MKKRAKYFAIGYLIGYVGSLSITGIPEWYYLIPVKFLGVFFSIFFGNAMYYQIEEDQGIPGNTFRLLKYIFPLIILLMIVTQVQIYLYEEKGIDISFIVGFYGN